MRRPYKTKNVPKELQGTIESFRLQLVCDALRALRSGYSRENLTLIVISADNDMWRANFIDRVLPRADWGAIRRRGERPFAIGVAPKEIRDMLDGTYPMLGTLRERSMKDSVYPVVAIGPRDESLVSAIFVPDL